MDFNFRLADTEKEIKQVVDFFSKNPWNYKNYDKWVQKAEAELYLGIKQGILALNYNSLIGNLISQPHKTISGFCEMKNGRILNKFNRGFVFSFMIRQTEIKAREEGNLAVICDARSNNIPVCNLLRSNGYLEAARADLYNEGYEDIVFIKDLKNKNWNFN